MIGFDVKLRYASIKFKCGIIKQFVTPSPFVPVKSDSG